MKSEYQARKLLAVVLAVIMLLSLMPISTFMIFAETDGLFKYSVEDEEVTITGLADSNTSGSIEIPSIIGGCPVTAIGAWAFYNCSGITSVSIPNTVTAIHSGAFSECWELATITIPDSVAFLESNVFDNTAWYNNQPDGLVYAGNVAYKFKGNCPSSIIIREDTLIIADRAFIDCNSLTSVMIPNSVIKIGDYAFSNTGLISIIIPNSVTSIGEDVFSCCTALESITVQSDNPVYHSKDNCLIETKSKVLISGCKNSIIPTDGSVTKIGYAAFSGCSGLISINIPDGVTSIGVWAFSGCAELKSVTIPQSIRYIDLFAFEGCNDLETVNYTGTIADWCNIGFSLSSNPLEYAHNFCINNEPITELVIPNTVTKIGEEVFRDFDGLTSITIPDSVISIGDGAFEGCFGLTSITIPHSVTSIGEFAFNCTGLESITIPDSVTSIGMGTFRNTKYYNDESNWENGVLYIGNHLIEAETNISGEYFIKPGTKTIADSAFHYCTGLTSINIPSSVTSIGEYAFSYCTELTGIIIPDNATSIGCGAFEDTRYYNDQSNWENGVLYIGNHLIGTETDISGEYHIKPGTKTIADSAFCDCANLTGIIIPASLTKICEYSFDFCSAIESITVDNNNAVYHSVNNCLIETESKTLILGCNNSIIPNDGSVTSIGNCAFECADILEVSIPISVTSIGDFAFAHSSLTSVEIPNNVTEIGAYAFGWNSDLKEVYLPKSLSHISYVAFYGCFNLTDIYYEGDEQTKANKKIDNWVDSIDDSFIDITWHYNYQPQTYISGDINNDGKVNNKDLTRLFQHLSSWEVEVNELALDVNGDGKQNNKDLTRLFQYLSGWDVEIH